MTSNILLYRNSDGAAFSAPVLFGGRVGNTGSLGNWEKDWAQVVSFRRTEAPFLLLYRNSGVTFTAPVLSDSNIGPTTHIGDWADDWAQIVFFEFSGAPYLLFYRRTDGQAFTAPILPAIADGTTTFQLGTTTLVGRWEQDWAHLVSFRFNGAPFLLLYRDSGATFTAPILSGSQIGPTTHIGDWESDWAQIAYFRSSGVPYFLLYRNAGGTFTTPILSSSQIGATTHIGDWENDWTQILHFDIRTTTNFAYAYDPILTETDVINAEQILASLAETSESDFLKVQSLFRTTGGFGPGNHILVWVTHQIVDSRGLGGVNFGWGPVDRLKQISINAGITDPAVAKCVLVAELAEIFMSYQAQAYQGKWNSGDSKGEALSLLIADLLYPNAGWVGDRVSSWLNDRSHPINVSNPARMYYARQNWIDVTQPTDTNKISYGCGLLFMYWLHSVKHYDFAEIIAAQGSTFAELFSTLTGGQSDAWLQFKMAVDNLYPESNNPSFDWNAKKTNNIWL